jgi:hypothetical protein
MYGYVLQDWITVRGSTTQVFIQNESDWIGFSSFQDIAFWIDVREITSAGTLTLNLQTAPTKDDVLFQPLVTAITMAVTSPPPLIVAGAVPKAILSSSPLNPLATWVRWTLTNSVASTWDATFRILASANRSVAG